VQLLPRYAEIADELSPDTDVTELHADVRGPAGFHNVAPRAGGLDFGHDLEDISSGSTGRPLAQGCRRAATVLNRIWATGDEQQKRKDTNELHGSPTIDLSFLDNP